MAGGSYELLDKRVADLAKARFGELTEIQEKAIPNVMAGKDVLVIAPTGFGKCVSGDTLILTKDGLTEIKDLYLQQLNTSTLGHDLRIARGCGAVVRKKKSQLFSLKTGSGRTIRATDDHKFLALDKEGLHWVKLKDLKTGDYVGCAKKLMIEESPAFVSLQSLGENLGRLAVKTSPGVNDIFFACQKKTGLGIGHISRSLGCHETTLRTGMKGNFIGAKLVKQLATLSGMSLDKIRVTALSAPGGKQIPVEVDEDLAYFAGLFAGDGNFNKGHLLRLSTASESIREFVESYCKRLGIKFGKDHFHKYDYYFCSKTLYSLLLSLGIPDKNKSANVRVPNLFFKDKRLLSRFLRGVFDTDGSIYRGVLELTSKSKRLIDGVSLALLCFGVFSVQNERLHLKHGRYYRLFIENAESRLAFSKSIGFGLRRKQERLDALLGKKANPNLDVIPNVAGLIKTCKEKMAVPYARASPTYRKFESYAYGFRNPTKEGLAKVLEFFKKQSKKVPNELEKLDRLANSDIYWDKVKSIEPGGEEYVYDATIPETHNFIGNGIILHNTESATLPVLSKMLANIDAGRAEGIQFLYITPLRALNRDQMERLTYWCHLLGISLAVRHGDTTQTERVKQREKPPQLLVTTPESLNSLLIAPKIRDNLRNIRWVVVDEVHELLDSKRGTQLSLALERLRERVGEKESLRNQIQKSNFQIIGLSATVGDEGKAAEFLSPQTAIVRMELAREVKLTVEYPSKAPGDEIPAGLGLNGATAARLERLTEIIERGNATLVFTNTRSLAESLSALLFQIEQLRGKIAVHHGSLAKEARLEAEREFKLKGEERKLKAIVCTSSLELGIDIGSVDQVVQYHSPRQVVRLLQRIGRSGHAKNLTPNGIMIAVEGMDCVESAVMAGRAGRRLLEQSRFAANSLDVLAHQIAGILLDNDGKNVECAKVFGIFRRAAQFKTLPYDEFIHTCKQLASQRLISLSSDYSMITTSRATKLYYYENLSTIPDLRKFTVKDAGTRRIVATLDEGFVAEYLSKDASFIARGLPWKVLSIAGQEVVVEQEGSYAAAVPDWVGEEIPVSLEACQEVASLFGGVVEGKVGEWQLTKDYHCAKSAIAEISQFAGRQKPFFIPKPKTFFVESSGKTAIIHSFAGNQVNETIGRALSFLVSASLGQSVRMRPSAFSMAFEFPKEYPLEKLLTLLGELKGDSLESVLKRAVPHTPMFRTRFVDVAKRFGLIRKDADLNRINLKRLVEANESTPVFREALAELLYYKLDVENAKKVLAEWKAQNVSKAELSPISKDFLEFYGFGELFAPVEPTEMVVKAFKENLLRQRASLSCNYCLNPFSLSLKEAGGTIACPNCGSTQATLGEYRAVVKKSLEGKPLTAAESGKLDEARRVESLISAYGGKALIALSTYGVGPQNAARLLTRLRDDDNEFHIDLLEAQKSFIKTRKYWRA